MHLHRSHDVASLADGLADLVAAEPLAWNQREWIAVQGRGMERWLSMRLAERLGGVLGTEFLFPRALVGRILERTAGLPDDALERWSADALAWEILALLPALLAEESAAPLRHYLAGEAPDAPIGARRLGLARELAALVDRYTTFRPAMVREWLEGTVDPSIDAWQPALLRALRARLDLPSHAELVERAIARLADGGAPTGVPRRIVLFGVTTLPPIDLALLDALSAHVEVHLFWLSATPHFVGDLRSRREIARERVRASLLRGRSSANAADAPAVESGGHPLLASLGRTAQDFQSIVLGVCEHVVAEHDRFEPAPDPATVLGRLRRDLYDASATGADPSRPRVPFPEEDRSVQIHACHGRTRQVEVLRDELLRAFVELRGLEPRDVVVLCPDVDTYAPLLRAVFSEGDLPGGEPTFGFPRIPVRIADTAPRHDAAAVDALLAMVALASGRFGAPEVADVLMRPAIARKFGLDAVPASDLVRWVRESGMRWGIDGAHRTAFGQPDDDAFTLRRGLDRILLGQAMRGDGTRAAGAILPYDDLDDRTVASGLVEALEMLFELADSLRLPRTPAQIRTLVASLLERAIDLPDDEAWQRDRTLDALEAALPRRAPTSGEPDGSGGGDALTLAPDAVRAVLESAFSAVSGPSGLLGGAVNVASLVPMRAIPFRVVCLLGLDESSFPRRAHGRGFDVTERPRQLGDRRLEDDDRAAMLEAILSARERLVVTYQGRDPHRNRELPMAAPVAELLETLTSSYLPVASVDLADAAAVREDVARRLVVHHALHAFGDREVDGTLPRAFDRRLPVHAETIRTRDPRRTRVFVDAPLPLRGRDERGRVLVHLDELRRFLDDPARSFLARRARVELDPRAAELDDREPYDLDGRERARLLTDAMHMTHEGLDAVRQRARFRHEGRLPVGPLGDREFESIRAEVLALLGVVAPIHREGRSPPLAVDRTFGDVRVLDEAVEVRLVGTVDERYPAGLVRLHPRRAKLAQQMAGYLDAAVARVMDGATSTAHVVSRGKPRGVEHLCLSVASTEAAERYVHDALSVFLVGLRVPLPFDGEAAAHYLRALAKSKAEPDLDPRVAAARTAFARFADEGARHGAAARERVDLRTLFGDPLPVTLFDPGRSLLGGPDFETLVDALVRPVVRARVDADGGSDSEADE